MHAVKIHLSVDVLITIGIVNFRLISSFFLRVIWLKNNPVREEILFAFIDRILFLSLLRSCYAFAINRQKNIILLLALADRESSGNIVDVSCSL